MANNSVSCLIFLLLVFVLAISEVKGKICEKPSKTWFGICKDTDKCDHRCIEWEGAKHGSCHEREAKLMCFCYFDCDPKKNPGPPPGAPTKPPVGGEGGVPAPPGVPPSPPPAGEAPPDGEGGAPPPEGGGGEGGGGGGGEGGGGEGGAPPETKGKICEKPSKTWFGTCKDTDKCDHRCIDWEGAKHGACHQREAEYMCFCYFDCDPKKNPGPPSGAPTKPPVGGEGGTPAPPGVPPSPPSDGEGGGGAPPPEGGGDAPPPGGDGGGGGGGGEGGALPAD